MALPTQSEVLKLSIVNELNHGHDLSIILDKLVAAIEGNACGPNIETEEPQCKTALLRVIECGSISYVEKFMKLGCSINYETSKGETPLSESLKLLHQEMVVYLIHSCDAKLDHVNRFAESALTHAIRINNDPDTVQWILSQPNSPKVRPCDITEAIIQGKHRVLVKLLEYDLKIYKQFIKDREERVKESGKKKIQERADKKGETKSEKEQEQKIVEDSSKMEDETEEEIYHLLEQLDPSSMRTPLMTAASGGQSGTVVLLLDRGANPGKKI
jgi:hypothetical protein